MCKTYAIQETVDQWLYTSAQGRLSPHCKEEKSEEKEGGKQKGRV